MSEVEEGALVHCAEAFQYGPTSVSSAGSQPAPVQPPPILDLHIYVLKFSNISSSWQTHTHTRVCVCGGVRGVLQAQGWQRQPSHSAQLAALSSLSVHLSLCSLLPPSSCSPSRPISQPSRTQLAFLHCSGLPSKTQLSS